MKFFAITVAAFAALAQAIKITNSEINPVAGESYEITWSEASGPVTLKLKYGPSTSLTDVLTIASDVDSAAGSYTWSVPTDLVTRSNYAFYITDTSGAENYSLQFGLEGTGEGTTAASSAATTAAPSSATSEASTTEAPSTLSTAVSSESSKSAESTASESSKTTKASSSTPAASTNTNATVPDSKAGRLGSPVALILTLAAMLYFH